MRKKPYIIKRYLSLRGIKIWEFNQYNTTVQQWIHTVLENRETNADVVLECCRDIIAYGRETDDPKLMGFGFFYGGEIYYELNDGAHFSIMMTEALTYLDRAEEWELVVRCYNFLGIASMSRGKSDRLRLTII